MTRTMTLAFKATLFVLALVPGLSAAAATIPTVPSKIVNTPAEPIPVVGTVKSSEAGTPFQLQINYQGDHIDDGGGAFQVPAGKRLIIEFVTYRGAVVDGTAIWYMSITTKTGAPLQTATHEFTPVLQLRLPDPLSNRFGSGVPVVVYGFAQSVRLFADGGTTVTFKSGRTTENGVFPNYVTISGRLLDAP